MSHWRGAAACCVNENHEILMVLQGKPDEEFKWAVPSGGVEPGETFTECCVREVWEETGFDVEVTEKLFEKRGQSYGWDVEVHYFRVTILSGVASIQDPDVLIHEVAWKSRADILDLELSFPEDRELLLELTSPPSVASNKGTISRKSPLKDDMSIRELQKYIRNKDHNPELKLQYLQKLVEEVGELARAMRTNIRYQDTQDIKGTIDEELYDVLYYVVALANIYEVELQDTMQLKEAVNLVRYGRNKGS